MQMILTKASNGTQAFCIGPIIDNGLTTFTDCKQEISVNKLVGI